MKTIRLFAASAVLALSAGTVGAGEFQALSQLQGTAQLNEAELGSVEGRFFVGIPVLGPLDLCSGCTNAATVTQVNVSTGTSLITDQINSAGISQSIN